MANTKTTSNKKPAGRGGSRSGGGSSGGKKKTAVSTARAYGSRSASSGGRSASSGGRPASSGRGRSRSAAPRDRIDTGREIFGVVLVILGILLGIFCYFGSSGLLSAAAPLLFGLFGIMTYAVPVILIGLGVMLIAVPDGELRPGTVISIIVILFAVLGLIHVITRGSALVGAKFGDAVSDAITYGKAHRGGGFFGGLVAYLFVLLLGKVGSIVALIGVIIIAALLLTHFSIGNYARELHTAYVNDAAARREKRKPYNEQLTDDGKKTRRNEPVPDEQEDEEFIPHSGDPLTAGDTDYDYGRSAGTKRPAGRTEAEPSADRNAGRHRVRFGGSKNKHEGELDFLPVSGPLETGRSSARRRDKNSGELKDSFNVESGNYGDWVSVPTKPRHRIPIRKPADGELLDSPSVDPANAIPADVPDNDILDGVVISRYDDPEHADPIPAGDETAEPVMTETIPVTYDDGTGEEAGEEKPKKPENESTEAEDGDAITENPVVIEYQRPPLDLLKLPDPTTSVASEPPEEKARLLIESLRSFNISAKIVNISVGPVITRFELQPAQGIRVSKITSLSNDIALALAAPRVRIEAPIPGKSAIGIEIPNSSTITVYLRELFESSEFQNARSPLTFALGKDIAGKVVLGDLSKMPHMLVAGQTGSGKSVCINGIILSAVYKSSPKDVRMILIDPKVVELSIFQTLPHLFCPVVTEPKKAASALRWAVNEMDARYKKMAEFHARDIDRFNAVQKDENERWPRLMIIIDELADLMLVAAKDVEDSICRIAQLGRACGIHLIVATQRPSVDVITGLIKANIPSRIAFAVSNGTDSRVILDTTGAEKLLGRGDMLFHPNGASKPTRAQGAFVSDEEVEAVAEFFATTTSQKPVFKMDITEISTGGQAGSPAASKEDDDMLPDALRLVIENKQASISMLQRRLRIGYSRAGNLIDCMEQRGYITKGDGAKPRNVLITAADFNQLFGGDMPTDGDQ